MPIARRAPATASVATALTSMTAASPSSPPTPLLMPQWLGDWHVGLRDHRRVACLPLQQLAQVGLMRRQDVVRAKHVVCADIIPQVHGRRDDGGAGGAAG